MGIHDLLPFIKQLAPQVLHVRRLEDYKGHRIAIDVSLYIFKTKVLHGKDWLKHISLLFNSMRKHGVSPLVVFDGNAPEAKHDEQAKRRDARNKMKNNVLQLKKELCNYKETGIIGKSIEKLTSKTTRLLTNKQDVEKITKKRIEAIERTFVSITDDDTERLQTYLKKLKIPYIQAVDEAEKACSYLVHKGYCKAALSEDSDLIAYQTPATWTQYNHNAGTVIELHSMELLDALSLNSDQFLDMCIMFGCDYNSRVKNIGPARAYKYIKVHHSIESVADSYKLDKECLNTDLVRDLFSFRVVPIRQKDIDAINTLWCGETVVTDVSDFFKDESIDSDPSGFVHSATGCYKETTIEKRVVEYDLRTST